MASAWFLLATCLLSFIVFFHEQPRCILADKIDMGVVLGLDGNDMPRPVEIVDLFHQYSIGKIRLLRPNKHILNALRNSDIDVTISVPNDEILLVSPDQTAAELWFQNNLAPFVNHITFSYIAVGNQAIPGPYAANVTAAMYNLRKVLRGHGLYTTSVTTIVSSNVLENMYPPSAATFTNESKGTMVKVLNFLRSKIASPVLLINVYPYYIYSADPDNIGLDFAQFTATQPKFQDMNLSYYNLFDAMVDGFFWAMEKVGASDVVVGVTETGWPFYGNEQITTPLVAANYNKKFMERILSHVGTPKRPGMYIEGFIYSMFVENLKPNGVPQSFGIFDPATLNPYYSLFPES